MLKNVLNALSSAARAFIGNWRTLAIIVVVYLALLGSLYYFFVTPLARIWQVAITLMLAIITPVVFFALQTLGVNYALEGITTGAMLGGVWKKLWKLMVASLPVLLIAILAQLAFSAVGKAMNASGGEWPEGTKGNVLSGIWYLVMCFVLPLFAIQLWIAASQTSLAQTFKSIVRTFARTFSPQSILTYAIGFIFFAVIPYFLIVQRTPIKRPWLDLTMLGARIALALIFMLFGWIVTLGALSRLKPGRAEIASDKVEHAPPSASAVPQP